jgi:hypothetical protein
VVCAWGGATSHVHVSATIFDQYQTWAVGSQFYSMKSGTDGVSINRFGDYFQVQQHPEYPNTFVGTGHAQVGGTGPNGAEPRFAWFGREDVEPAWVHLDVQASGVGTNNVDIQLDRNDRLGLGSGTTPFTREFVKNQDYTLTAPLETVFGRVTYAFDHWSLRIEPSGGFNDQPVGERVLAVGNIGGLNDTAIARYLRRRRITVDSLHVAPVVITVSLADIHGQQDGKTSFLRDYRDSATPVLFTAPAIVSRRDFYRWQSRTTNYPLGQLQIAVVPDQDHELTAVYGFYTPGAMSKIGAGCVGSNLRTPTHSANTASPEIGNKVSYDLTFGPAASVALLALGFNKDTWGGVPLPLLLPGTKCSIYNEMVVSFGAPTSQAGSATVILLLPADPSLIGATLYTQYWCVDPKANPYGLTTSNSLGSQLGGWRF